MDPVNLAAWIYIGTYAVGLAVLGLGASLWLFVKVADWRDERRAARRRR